MENTLKQMIPTWIDGELKPVEKLLVHQKGYKHKAISVFLIHNERLLIQRRALSKYHTPGLWANTCCTHPLWEETDFDCAKRRMIQELGIEGLDYTHSGEIEYRADVGQGLIEHEVAQIFVTRTAQQPQMTLNPVEVMGVRWISIPDLLTEIKTSPNNFTPWIKTYLLNHNIEGLTA